MAERKRGLGRGIGALIPDVVTDERPVDVFFPEGPADEGAKSEPRAARHSDPSESMRLAAEKKKQSRKSASSTRSRAGSAAKSSAKADDTTAKRRTSKASVAPSAAQQAAQKAAEAVEAAKDLDASQDRPTDNEAAQSAEPQTELQTVPGTAFGLIPIEQIRANPRQPRTIFDEDALAELVQSIKQVGVLQPVVVRLVDQNAPQYELIMGERRFRASQEAGLTEIPAVIRATSDDDLLRDALLENLHRADLNPLEEAAAYEQLLSDFACTQEELSERIGRSRPQISNTLRLLKLPGLVQRRVAAGVISQGHARAILGLNDASLMEALAQRVVAEGLSVRATEEAVVLLNRGDAGKSVRSQRAFHPELDDVARTIGDLLDTRVQITMGKRKGKISVEFANAEDLERITKLLGVSPEA